MRIIFDELLLVGTGQGVETLPKDEFTRKYKNHIKEVFVACLGVSVQRVQKENEERQVVDAQVMFIEEQITAREALRLSVPQAAIEEIYKFFSPAAVVVLVPYPVAVRAYLRHKGFLNDNRAVIVIDALGSKMVVTIFRSAIFSESRQIIVRDREYMIEEIKRSWLIFSQDQEERSSYVIVSNNRDWLSACVDLKLARHEEVLDIGEVNPALDGLKVAKFTNNYVLPNELAQRKRKQMRLNWIFQGCMFMGSVILGGIIVGLFWIKEKRLKEEYVHAQEQVSVLNRELENTYKNKFVDYLDSLKNSQWDDIFWDFYLHVPKGYLIKEFMVAQKERGNFWMNAVIVPGSVNLGEEFIREGKWSKANISSERFNEQMGTKIELSWKE